MVNQFMAKQWQACYRDVFALMLFYALKMWNSIVTSLAFEQLSQTHRCFAMPSWLFCTDSVYVAAIFMQTAFTLRVAYVLVDGP